MGEGVENVARANLSESDKAYFLVWTMPFEIDEWCGRSIYRDWNKLFCLDLKLMRRIQAMI